MREDSQGSELSHRGFSPVTSCGDSKERYRPDQKVVRMVELTPVPSTETTPNFVCHASSAALLVPSKPKSEISDSAFWQALSVLR